MRTKVLLALAALAVGLSTSMAQVYSLNVVGYVNVTVAASGFALLGNPLKTANNTLDEVIPAASMPAGTYVSTWDAANVKYFDIIDDGTAWVDPATGNPLGTATKLPPGTAFLLQNPDASPHTITFVGEVLQGDVSIPLPTGFTAVSSKTPQVLDLGANGFPQVAGTWMHDFDIVNVKYIDWINDGTQWVDPATGNPVTLTPGIGRGYLIENPGSPMAWTRTFTVN